MPFHAYRQSRQAYGAINFLDSHGVWDFCHGRGQPYGRLTPDQEERLRRLYLPEVEALAELLRIDLSAWKKPRSPRTADNIAAVRASSVPRATGL